MTTNTQPSQHLLGWDSFDYPLFFDIRVITLAWADRKMLQRMASNGSKLVVEHHPLAQVTTTYGNAGTAMRNHSIQNGSISLQWFHNKLTQWRAITKKAVMCIFFAGFYIFSSKFLLAPIEFRGTANPLEKLIDSLKDQLATRLPEVAWVKCSLTMGIHGSAFFNQPIC